MLPTETVETIRFLFEKRKKGIRYIARHCGVSRQAVRRHAFPERYGKGRSVGRPESEAKVFLQDHSTEVRDLFLRCEGRTPVVARRLREQFDIDIPMWTLRRFCVDFRQELKDAEAGELQRYETAPGMQLQIDFAQFFRCGQVHSRLLDLCKQA